MAGKVETKVLRYALDWANALDGDCFDMSVSSYVKGYSQAKLHIVEDIIRYYGLLKSDRYKDINEIIRIVKGVGNDDMRQV